MSLVIETNSKEFEKHLRNAGYEAFKMGLGITANPHSLLCNKLHWNAGWFAARTEAIVTKAKSESDHVAVITTDMISLERRVMALEENQEKLLRFLGMEKA
jgi:hypothetical protein